MMEEGRGVMKRDEGVSGEVGDNGALEWSECEVT